MIRFIIGGLPRSGTTWLSAFLSTDDCVCLHDPSATMTPEDLENWSGGVCDTGLWYYEDWCLKNTNKFALIDRNIEDVNKSLANKSLPSVPVDIVNKFKQIQVRRFYFEFLYTEEGIRELWDFVYPEKEFNIDRFNLFKDIYITPIYMEKRNEAV